MPRAWSLFEVESVVADYFDMLDLELRGELFNKAKHNRAIQTQTGRSKGSIEMKHQNVSAILRELGWRYIDGYKPLGNYQDMLFDVVADRVASDAKLARRVAAEADAVPAEPGVEDILARLVAAPSAQRKRAMRVAETRRSPGSRSKVDYVAREARNVALGARGEQWVLAFERARLIKAGKEQFADRVEQVSVTHGDGQGFDIRSFEANGRDRLIEVKTTSGPKEMPFYVSSNEVATSRELDKRYHLYRPFNFQRDTRLFIVTGRLDRSCVLDPAQFRAQVA